MSFWLSGNHLYALFYFSVWICIYPSSCHFSWSLQLKLDSRPGSVFFFLNHCFAIIPAFRLGPVCRGQFGEVLSFLTTDRPHYHRMPPLSGDNHDWVVSAVRTGCALGHRATTIRACAHIWWKQLRDINYEPKVALSSPDPTSLAGSPGEVPASVHTMGLPGKVGPGKRDLMWTQGI